MRGTWPPIPRCHLTVMIEAAGPFEHHCKPFQPKGPRILWLCVIIHVRENKCPSRWQYVKFSIVVSEFCSPLSEAITSSGTKLKKTLILESAVVHYWQAPGPRDRPNHMLSISTDRRCHFIITERVEGEGGEREREERRCSSAIKIWKGNQDRGTSSG
jgi:hypothetical protein